MILNPPIFRLHFVILLWGFTAILGKLIVLDSLTMVWYRTGLSVIFLLLFALYSKSLLKIPNQTKLKYAFFGSIIALHWVLFFQAIKVSNVAIGLSTISTGALFTAILEPIFFKRKVDVYEIILSVIISICMIILFKAEFRYYEGIIYGLIASVLSSLFSVINGKIAHQSNSITILNYELIGGFVVLSLMLLLNNSFSNILQITTVDFSYLLIFASFFTAYPMLESIKLMKIITPFTLILSVNLEPIYGILFAYWIFGEPETMSSTFYIVFLVMICSILINGFLKMRKSQELLIKNQRQ